jgi:AraC-like DNA-binding protein
MPQSIDRLAERLNESHRHALREFFAHYNIEIISCLYWRNRAPWMVATRKCPDTFFLFPVRGKVRVTLETQRPLITPESYLALPDEETHALAIEKGHPVLEQIALHCRIQDRWRRPLLARFPSRVARLRDPARWHRVLADLASLMNLDPELGQERGKNLVRELIIDRLRHEAPLSPMNRSGDPRIEIVLHTMKEQLASPTLSIEALADEIHLTATQMRKLFRRETRMGPKEYLHQLRLEQAAYLLRHSTQTIKQIALDCGFATDNYFHLVFRKAFGVTPTAFREKEIL